MLVASPLAAQRAAPPRFAAGRAGTAAALRADTPVVAEPDYLGMTMGGVTGAVLGMLAGGSIGGSLDNDPDIGLTWGLVGGMVAGSALVVPTFVHLANHGRGSLARELAASALTGGLGLLVAAHPGSIRVDPMLIAWVLTPIAQIVAAEAVEAHATRSANTSPAPPGDRR